MADAFVDYTGGQSAPAPSGWDQYPYVYQDVPPPETTFEHIAKALGGLAAAHGLPSIRTRQDMWLAYQKGKETGNTSAISQEQGDTARAEEEVGLPRTRAYYEAQRYAESPEIARQNMVLRQQNAVRQQQNQESLDASRNAVNYGRIAPSIPPDASMAEANDVWKGLGNRSEFPSRTVGQTPGTVMGNDLITQAASELNPADRIAAGLGDQSAAIREPVLPTPKTRRMTIEEAQQDIEDRGQKGNEVVVWDPVRNSYEPKPRTASNSMDLAKLHIHAIELNHELDGIAKDRRALNAPHRGGLTADEIKNRDTQLAQLETRRVTATTELHKLIGASPDLSQAVDHARDTGNGAARIVQPAPEPTVDTEEERSLAQSAIDGGAPEDLVKARYKERTGEEF